MIIDKSYFKGEISIPSNKISDNKLEMFIALAEPDILRDLLGETLYQDYLANPTAEKWVKFVEGHEYTYDGYTVKWQGLKNSQKISLLAYFTFERLARAEDSYLNTSGGVQGVSDKGNTVSVNSIMTQAQCKGVDLYGKCTDSPLKPTAYNFIKDGGYDFDNWVFTPIEKINILGI